MSVKRALHTAVPERLLSREAERASIRSFLEEHVLQRRPGSLYISGAPGTGKTACFNCVLQEMKVSAATPGGHALSLRGETRSRCDNQTLEMDFKIGKRFLCKASIDLMTLIHALVLHRSSAVVPGVRPS